MRICDHDGVRLPRRVAAAFVVAVMLATGCSAGDRALDATGGATPAVASPAPEPGPSEPDVTEAGGSTPRGAPTTTGEAQPTEAPPAPTTGATPTTVPETDTLPSPAAEASPTPTPAAAADDGCTAALTGEPTSSDTARADLDGDGSPDQVTTYRSADDWRIRVDTAAGESLDSPIGPSAFGADAVTPLGGADVDGDGATAELFTVVGAGASALLVAIHTRVGCELEPATIAGGPVAFPIGGGIGTIGGLTCIDSDDDGVVNAIVAWTGIADFEATEGTFDIEGVEYELRGTELRQVGTRSFTTNVARADFVYAQLTCGPVTL